jgi:cadmium resistance protein CadD (predicted permease)
MTIILKLQSALAAFLATNADNLVAVSALCVSQRCRPGMIAGGFFLGTLSILLLSATAARWAITFPVWASHSWLLGLVPLAIGVRKLWAFLASGGAGVWRASTPQMPGSLATTAMQDNVVAQLLISAGLTISCSADNLAVYTPMFIRDPRDVPLYAVSFALLSAVLYAVARTISNAGFWRRPGQLVSALLMILVAAWLFVPQRGI